MISFAPLYPVLYHWLKPMFPSCLWCGNEESKALALTFDDGPSWEYTPQLLEVLGKYQVTASFFCLGVCVERYPEIAQQIIAQGHFIGLHGYQHQSFTSLSKEAIKESLAKTQETISQISSLTREQLIYVRPPNGLFTPEILSQLQADNYRVVMWSVVSEDWRSPGIEIVKKRIFSQIHNGSIIVLHDGYYGGKEVAQISADLIPRLLDQGYYFLTVEQMWQDKFFSENNLP
jgi:peptidoglycan/xylan/chitin deacetylase (PgdA/CDA1 family)